MLSLLFRSKARESLSFWLAHIFIKVKIIIFIIFFVWICKFRKCSSADISLWSFGKGAFPWCFRCGQMRCCHCCRTCWIIWFVRFLLIIFFLNGKISFDLFTILFEKRCRGLLGHFWKFNILFIFGPPCHRLVHTLFSFRSFNLIGESSHYFWLR